MHLQDCYKGTNTPFEGDLTVSLRSLPAGAKVTHAIITLHPTQYQGIINFNTTPPILGVTKAPDKPPAAFIEIDFHARRTLKSVTVTGGKADLQVDMGGNFMGVAKDGTFIAPDKNPFVVNPDQDQALPGMTVSKFRLNQHQDPPPAGSQTPPTPPLINVTQVTISSFPSNVNVRLGQPPAFWTLPGELAVDTTSPDFTLVLNTFLTTAQPQNGFYLIPFTIHSDTIAQMDILIEIDYVIDQPVLPSYLSEINLSYAFNLLPDTNNNSPTVTLPRGAMPVSGASTAKIIGQFQPTRIALNRADNQSPTVNVLVSPDCSLAQPLQSDTEIEVTGIDLPLYLTTPGLTGLNIAIRADQDGKPSSTVLASANITIGKPLPNQSVWGSATLPKSFRILPLDAQGRKIRYWLVLQSQNGQANWRAVSGGDPPLQCSSDGLSWRAANGDTALAPLSAQFRLRNKPDTFTMPLQLQIGTNPGATTSTLDKFAPLGKVELSFDFSKELGDYLTSKATASPCGSQDLVVNGNFTNPPPDNASVRLFGVESAETSPIRSLPIPSRGIDLSIEHFITLSTPSAFREDYRLVKIDCAGRVPAQTTVDEIVNAINARTKQLVTATQTGNSFFLTAQQQSAVKLFPWCSDIIPTGWQSTANQIYRYHVPMPDKTSRIVALLANLAGSEQLVLPTRTRRKAQALLLGCLQPLTSSSELAASGPISLSQQLSVTAGCTYHLSISYQDVPFIERTPQTSPQSPTEWKVIWFDTNGRVLGTDGESLVTQSKSISNMGTLLTTPPNMVVDTLLAPPPNAVNADLQLINSDPDTHALILGPVSFIPTLETVRNGQFLQPEDDPNSQLPSGWTIESGLVTVSSEGTGVTLNKSNTYDTILSQTLNVVAGSSYRLQVRAWPVFPQTNDTKRPVIQQHARVEIQWIGSTSPSNIVNLSLDDPAFSESDWTGVAPAGVSQAEIRLILPKQATYDLQVKSVTLAGVDNLSIPLTFLSVTPGQLTVSNMHVVYDVPETS